MKPLKTNRLAVLSLGSILFCQTAGAATITKANNATQLNNNAAWVGNIQPGAADIALWDSTVTTATATTNFFNANGSPVWGQVAITNPGADIFISDSGNHQLKLDGVSDGTNAVGLDMSAATVDLRIGATVILNNPQVWKVATGRTVTFHSGITNPERLTFTGGGNLATGANITLSTPQTHTGKTSVVGGTLTLNGNAQLASTSAVEATGSTLVIGATTGTGVTNRINPAAPLTIGGVNGPATVTLAAGATPVNSQTFGGLTIDKGFATINNTNGVGALSFNGAYNRLSGGFVNFGANSLTFAAAPTGAGVVGTGGNEILLGASLADADFVKAAAGGVSAAAYSLDAFGAGLNTDLTVTGTFADVTAQSLRVAGATNPTFTLSGTNTVESGMILVSSNGTANVTGGTIQPGVGRNLALYSGGSKNLNITSVLADNGGASGLEKFGGGTVNIGGDNTFTGPLFLQGGFIELRHANGLGSPTATTPLNVTGGTTIRSGAGATMANVTIARPINLSAGQTLTYDTNGVANTVTISGLINTNAFILGGVSLGGTGTLSKNGEGTLNFTGTTGANLNLGLNITGGKINVSGNFTGNAGAFGFNGRNMTTAPVGSTVPEINLLSGGTLSNAKDWNFSGENNSLTLNMAEGSTAVAGRLFVGKGKSTVARFNQNGGNLTAGLIGLNSDNYIENVGSPVFSGIYSLNGGTLTNQNVTVGTGGVINLNSGLWKVTGGGNIAPFFNSTTNFISYGKIFVKAGGAKIEATAGTTNLNVPLEHETGLATADGGLVKTGTGIVNLNAAGTYNGGTKVQAGTLVVGTAAAYGTNPTTSGKLGTGAVSVEGGVLTLTAADAIADSAVLSFSGVTPPVINLNSATPETLGTVVDGNDPSKNLTAGTFTAAQLNTFFGKTVFAGTGSVIVSAPIVDGYSAWATGKGLDSSNNGKTQDADNDGYTNLIEYAVGGDPLKGDDRGVKLVKIQDVSGQQALTLSASIRSEAVFVADPLGSGAQVASVGGSTYRIEASTDLVNWTRTVQQITAITTGLPASPPAGTIYHTFRTTDPVAGTPKEFIRLRVTTP